MKKDPQDAVAKDLEKQKKVQINEEKLVWKAQNGDRNAMDFMLTRYKYMVKNKTKTYFLIGADHDDVIQEGMIGLFKAIRDFRPDRQTSFSVFADMCITRQIITALKKTMRQKQLPLNHYVSFNHPGFGKDAYLKLEETVTVGVEGNPETILIDRENLEDLETSLQKLMSGLEGKVLNAYLEGKGYREIAQELGKSPKVIDNALQRIKRKVAAYMKTRV